MLSLEQMEQINDSVLFFGNGSESVGLFDNVTSNFTEESLEFEPPHPHLPLPYNVLLMIAIYLTVVGILSTFGNILFILTVIRWRYLRNNSHMLLLLNMAVSDLAISITGYPYTTISGYIGKWVFGPIMCQLYAFLCFTFSQVSMNTLVVVSIFRYIAICRPHMKHYLTSRTSVIALFGAWLHALFWTISPLVGWSSYTFEPTRISCSFDWNDRTFGGVTYVIGTTLFCYISHIIVLVWCYKRIFETVYHLKGRPRDKPFRKGGSSKATTSSRKVDHPSQLEQNEDIPPDSPPVLPRCQSLIVFSFTTENLTEMELHVLGMNIAMVFAFIIFWTPYAIISVISAFYDKLSPFWYIFPTIFAKTSCMINPILYGLTNSFLRKQLLLVLRGFLGMTTAIEDFEVMRQRQQDGLYNKEGIFVGRRTGAITHCPCEGCVASRRQMKFLIEKQKIQASAANNSSKETAIKQEAPAKNSVAFVAATAVAEEPGESKSKTVELRLGEGEMSVAGSYDFYNNVEVDDEDAGADDEKESQQRQPSPMSIASNEFTQKGAHLSSSNAIILSVSALSSESVDRKATVLGDSCDDTNGQN